MAMMTMESNKGPLPSSQQGFQSTPTAGRNFKPRINAQETPRFTPETTKGGLPTGEVINLH